MSSINGIFPSIRPVTVVSESLISRDSLLLFKGLLESPIIIIFVARSLIVHKLLVGLVIAMTIDIFVQFTSHVIVQVVFPRQDSKV